MRELFSLRTVRSKIVMMTKAAGVILILSYFASKKLPFSEDVSSLIWAVFIVVLTLILDALLGRCITRPVAKLCEQAQKTAQLDFSGACAVTTADEFGLLADSLNQMAKNLQGTLARLEAANAQNCPGGVAFSFSVPSVLQRGKNRCIGVDMKKSVC